MKLLYALRSAATQIALPLALVIALVPTSAGAEEPAVGSKEWWVEFDKIRAAADVALEKVMLNRAMDQAMKDYGDSEFAKALPVFLRVQSGTNFSATTAQFLLGQMHQSGYGVVANEDEAIRYYKLAAAGGSDGGWPVAHYILGNIYNANSNYADAETQYRKFTVSPNASGGDKAEARYQLGKIYSRGEGVPQDYAVAGEQFGLAALSGNGHNDARYELGMAYLEGKGVGQDYAEAAKHFQIAAVYNEAADQPGVVDAQYALGSLYATGRGVAQSDTEAMKYLRMAASDDHTKAQFAVGMMFAAGKGVPQSISTAYLWIARAAEGDASTRGLSDISKAMIGAENGTAQAIAARDSIRARMTAEQIADAQILVDRCIASSYACNWGD